MALRLGVYVPNISAGRGWVALVAIFLGLRRPFGVLAAATLFAVLESLATATQGIGVIPGTVLLSVPYLLTFVAIVVYSAVTGRFRVER
jgi:simple sugar transport system permease protein